MINHVLGLLFFAFTTLLAFFSFGQNEIIPPLDAPTTLDFPPAQPTHDAITVLKDFSKFRQVAYEKDVIYIEKDGEPLTLQVIRANHPFEEKLPAVVFIPGSAWKKQNLYSSLPYLLDFAKRGFNIFLVEYRATNIAPYHPFPAQVEDVKTAIRFIRKNAQRFKIDENQIFLWGTSSGGHTAVMVGAKMEDNEFDPENFPGTTATVNAIVNYFGPSDISKMNRVPSTMDHISPESPEGWLIGRKNVLEYPELAQATNPINYLNPGKKVPPILIMHGDRDRLVPFNQSEILAEALKSNKLEYKFYLLKNADHGSFEFWTNKTLDIVEDFMRKHAQLH